MKEKKILQALFGKNPGWLLSALSSSYSEGNRKDFKNDFGCTIEKAEEVVEKFLTELHQK